MFDSAELAKMMLHCGAGSGCCCLGSNQVDEPVCVSTLNPVCQQQCCGAEIRGSALPIEIPMTKNIGLDAL